MLKIGIMSETYDGKQEMCIAYCSPEDYKILYKGLDAVILEVLTGKESA